MTTVLAVSGGLETKLINLTSVDEFEIVTATDSIGYRTESICAATDDTATGFSLWIRAGGADHFICNNTPIAANGSLVVTHPVVLARNWSLICKADGANHISVTASIAKITKSAA